MPAARLNPPGFAPALLSWYDREKRDLPWRRAPTAYGTLVSELMLQQTVVGTVVPYFQNFLTRFPTVQALALASEQEVMTAWAGLGYYRRARHLHQAARRVVADHGGRIPLDEEVLRGLPGVGDYTAAAVAAIAGDRPTFALDGNAARVVARLFAVAEPIDKPAVRSRLRALGQTLVPVRRAGDFAQAIMELGARVCIPGQPRCSLCPVRKACVAFREGNSSALPVRLPKRPRTALRLVSVALLRKGRWLLMAQPERGLLAGTFNLPAVERRPGEREAAAVARALSLTGLRALSSAVFAGTVTHIFTHRDARADVYCARAGGRLAGGQSWAWWRPGPPSTVPLSSFALKLLATALAAAR